MYGARVGELTTNRNALSFNYSDDARAEHGLGAPLLSVSMPTHAEPYRGEVVHAFFDGLLPEGEARRIIAYDFDVDERDVVAMLRILGRDCAGALVVLPAGQEPPVDGAPEAISESDVAGRLRRLGTHPLGVDGKVRASLAGLQRKLLLARLEDGWGLPVDGAPSTHLLKPPHHDTRFPNLISNEALCMRIAQHLGVRAASIETSEFEGIDVLIIERFDRTHPVAGETVRRIHQEDFCQASGHDGTLTAKYEENGGPSLGRCAEIIRDWSEADQLERLLEVTTLNLLVGNADAHGKNLSLLHGEDGRVALAPAYDVFSTLFYPDADTTAGMFVNGVTNIAEITLADLIEEATGWGLDRERVVTHVAGILERAETAVARAAGEIAAPDDLVDMLTDRARQWSGAAAAAAA